MLEVAGKVERWSGEFWDWSVSPEGKEEEGAHAFANNSDAGDSWGGHA